MRHREAFQDLQEKKTVRKEWLEDLVIAETMKLIQDDAVIDAIVAEVMELQDQENTTLPLLEKQMREVENGIEKYAERHSSRCADQLHQIAFGKAGSPAERT